MIGLLQRVSSASVTVDGSQIATINAGLLVLVGVERGDSTAQAERLAERLLNYRVFADAEQKMNLCVTDIGGEVLLVPQFTLAADTQSGTRPGFSTAATPDRGRELFERYCDMATQAHSPCEFGQFGADMQVSLVNDGPVTFWLHVH